MNGWKILAVCFAIGFGFRLLLESLFPYSAIGFDPMGQYILELYRHPALIQLLPRGILYYLISRGINSIINNPLATIKILDSLISGIFLASMYYFASRSIESRYILVGALVAFFSYQFLSLSWGFEKELLAFSIFLIIATMREFSARTFAVTLPLVVLSGLTDPTVVPLEFFWFIFLGIRDRDFLVYDVILAALGAMELGLFSVLGDGGAGFAINLLANMYTPSHLAAVGALALIMLIPFVLLAPDLIRRVREKSDLTGTPVFGVMISLLIASIVASYFAPRYVLLSSVLLFLVVPFGRRESRTRVIALVAIVVMVAASFVILPVSSPSPVFGSQLNMRSGEIDIVPGSFAQSTVPINDAPTLVHLYASIDPGPSNSSRVMVVSMLYTAAYAYEAGIAPNHLVETYTNYNLMMHDAGQLNSTGHAVYTVWWTNGGWYGVSHLPSNFTLVKSDDGFGLYRYS